MAAVVIPIFMDNAYAQSVGSPIASGGGGCSGDCTPPTLGIDKQGFRNVENGFTINGNSYNVAHYHQTIPTQTFTITDSRNFECPHVKAIWLQTIQSSQILQFSLSLTK